MCDLLNSMFYMLSGIFRTSDKKGKTLLVTCKAKVISDSYEFQIIILIVNS